eukprot:SAG11_NODE_8430_length_1016_cov_1.104689_2_plen_74_part_00
MARLDGACRAAAVFIGTSLGTWVRNESWYVIVRGVGAALFAPAMQVVIVCKEVAEGRVLRTHEPKASLIPNLC